VLDSVSVSVGRKDRAKKSPDYGGPITGGTRHWNVNSDTQKTGVIILIIRPPVSEWAPVES